MMKFEIKQRYTGAVLFALECGSMKLCVEAAVKAGSNLSYSDLRGSDLSGSNLSGSDLSYSDLRGSNLSGSNLRGSNLIGSDLIANLGQPNGWSAYTYCTTGEQRIQVGCQNLTLAEGREYWSGKEHRREVLAALDYAEAIGKLRGWVK
jgi:uncharacterized protein YjbI with pentapeptide repeats